jgi:hypothetical protein
MQGIVRKQGNHAHIWIQCGNMTFCLQRTKAKDESNTTFVHGKWAKDLEDQDQTVFYVYYEGNVGPDEDRTTGFPCAYPPPGKWDNAGSK